MPQFQFIIPAGEFSQNPNVPSSATTITPDRGFGRQSQHRVLTAKFGDGYEQRVLDGINSKQDSFSMAFNNRPASEINLLAKFLDNRAAKSFDLTVTDYDSDSTSVKVVCDSYNISYIQETVHSLQATFRRVYEP